MDLSLPPSKSQDSSDKLHFSGAKFGDDDNFLSLDMTTPPNQKSTRPNYNNRHDFNSPMHPDRFMPERFSSPVTNSGYRQHYQRNGRGHFRQHHRGNHGFGRQFRPRDYHGKGSHNNFDRQNIEPIDYSTFYHPSMLEDPWKNLVCEANSTSEFNDTTECDGSPNSAIVDNETNNPVG